MNIESDRLVDIFDGGSGSTTFIAIGGMHGNEPAGVVAMERLIGLLNNAQSKGDAVRFPTLVAVKGNVTALKKQTRQINEDLNRTLTPQRVKDAFSHPDDGQVENREIRGLVSAVRSVIGHFRPSRVVVIDLHTTTATGGCFAVTSPDSESERIANTLGAPVVRGIVSDVKGMTLSYFTKDNLGVETTTVIFESGQHEAPASIDAAIMALINCIKSFGFRIPENVQQQYQGTLAVESNAPFQVVELVHTHYTAKDDGFKMKPGYKNFHPVKRGELLATDKSGDIRSSVDGMVLMPRYLQDGIEGFFLVQAAHPITDEL
ncbi:MAG: hypothetical protein GKR96_06535 [Gammaproteobacteria bacterium]|nr:hypothetical protein [Gammaproteobacteria bacterium]